MIHHFPEFKRRRPRRQRRKPTHMLPPHTVRSARSLAIQTHCKRRIWREILVPIRRRTFRQGRVTSWHLAGRFPVLCVMLTMARHRFSAISHFTSNHDKKKEYFGWGASPSTTIVGDCSVKKGTPSGSGEYKSTTGTKRQRDWCRQ